MLTAPRLSAVTAPFIIAPSLLAADFARLGDEANAVAGDADWLHVDVMDNHFVPNLTIGLPVVPSLRKATALPFDCHLMIEDPERWAHRLRRGRRLQRDVPRRGAPTIRSRWRETCARPARKAGLAIDRDTPIEPYLEILPHFDTLLIMTIKAGFGGQAFMPEMLAKVRAARRHANAGHLELRIEVDGGIDEDTIAEARGGRRRRVRRRHRRLRRRRPGRRRPRAAPARRGGHARVMTSRAATPETAT